MTSKEHLEDGDELTSGAHWLVKAPALDSDANGRQVYVGPPNKRAWFGKEALAREGKGPVDGARTDI